MTEDESTPAPTDAIQGSAVASDAVAAPVSAGADALAETARLGIEGSAQAAVEAAGLAENATVQALDDARRQLRQAMIGSAGAATFEGADAMARQVAGGYEQAAQTLSAFNARALDAWRTNAEAALLHWQRLASVTSWSEVIALNTSHVRAQIEVITAQTRELAELAGRMARESADRLTPKA